MLTQDRVAARQERAARTMERVLQEVREKMPDLSREAKKKYAAELRAAADLLYQEPPDPVEEARQRRIDEVDEGDRKLTLDEARRRPVAIGVSGDDDEWSHRGL